MEDQVLDQPTVSVENYRYAGFWIRFVAIFIDGIILYVVQTVLSLIILGGMISNIDQIEGLAVGRIILLYLIDIVISWTYFAGLESSNNQATVGKMAVGVKVIDEHGQRLSFGKATGRYFAKILSGLILYIGFIMAGFDSRKQALHDKLANTFVVYKR